MRADAERARTPVSGRIAIAVMLMAMSLAVVALVISGHIARGQEPSPDVDVGVRIAAQRLENGHIRFGLRAQNGNGEWSAPVTPRAHRLDPANARTERWLSSSPVILEINDSGHGRVTRAGQFEPSSAREVVLVSGQDEWVGDVYYSAYHDDEGDLVTRASI
ncbi:MAG: hypothetical protein OXD50_14840 [Chloroflexi bacterium]|nr:hypothetical protein [Chloroflexota bacterium]